MPKRRYDAIYVKWTDSAGPERYWNHTDDFDNRPTTIHTRGYLLKETKEYVLVASSVSTSGCVGGSMSIPKSAITERKDG